MKVLGTILNVLGSLILLFDVRNIGTGLFLTQMMLGIGLIGFGCIIICLVEIRDFLRPAPKPEVWETGE